MKSTIRFLGKGLPISLIFLFFFMSGSGAMISAAIIAGLPWNIPGVLAILMSVLTQGGGAGMRVLFNVGMVWGFVAITINSSLLIAFISKLNRKNAEQRKT